MKRLFVPVLAGLSLMLAGCQIFSTKSLIAETDAAHPFELSIGETKDFRHCEKSDEDPTDWSDCDVFQIRREASSYVLMEGEDPEQMAVRFAPFDSDTDVDDLRFVFQTWEAEEAPEEYVYGIAEMFGDRLFISLPDAKYIPDETCGELGAPSGSTERECTEAMNTLDDLRNVMEEVWGAAQFEVFIEPV